MYPEIAMEKAMTRQEIILRPKTSRASFTRLAESQLDQGNYAGEDGLLFAGPTP